LIYICIPAHDEAQTVGVLLWKVRRVMADFARDYHIIVLDDASTDATAEVLEPYAKVVPLTILRSEKRLGYAGALERLLREAVRVSTHPKRDVVVTLQADFTESPDDIPGLIRKMEGGADVVGSVPAVQPGEAATRALRWARRGLPFLLPRSALPKEIRDPLSGFRAYRVNALRRAIQDRDGAPLLRTDGWVANVELLLAVLPHSRRADQAEVAVRYDRRERPTRFKAWPTARALWDLARRTPRGRALAAPAATAGASAAAAPAAPAPQQGSEPAPPRAPRPPRPPRQRAAEPAAAPAPEAAVAAEAKPASSRRRRGPRRRSEAAPALGGSEAVESTVATEPTAGPAPIAEGAGGEQTEGTPRRRSRPRGRRKPRQKPDGESSDAA
jgi:hypothetical protein